MMDLFDRFVKAIGEIGIPAALSGGLLLIVAFAAKHLIKGHLKFLNKIEECIELLVKYNKKSYRIVTKIDSTTAKVASSSQKIEQATDKIQESTHATKIAVDVMLKHELPHRNHNRGQ